MIHSSYFSSMYGTELFLMALLLLLLLKLPLPRNRKKNMATVIAMRAIATITISYKIFLIVINNLYIYNYFNLLNYSYK